MSASEREARDNLVASLVAGVAAVSGQNVATATGAGKIEVENNQVSIGRTVTGPQNVPQGMGGYFGEQRQKGDGVIADPATALDSTIKPTGSLIYPMPDAKTVGDWITELIPDQLKGLVEYVITAVNSRPGFRKQTVQDAWDKA
ncbi:VENN motif pre-toxin domain-containing protein, partial [Burkholderia pseudomallei]